MAREAIQKLKYYCKLPDTRGIFNGVLHHGNWQEVNIVDSNASTTRGGHYHRHTTEAIFVLSGKAEVELSSCEDPTAKWQLTLEAGEGIEIPPMTIHTFHYTEESTHLQLLNVRFDPLQQDLITV